MKLVTAEQFVGLYSRYCKIFASIIRDEMGGYFEKNGLLKGSGYEE